MGNANDSKPDAPEKTAARTLGDRFSEATSDKTVSDLAETDGEPVTANPRRDPGPSPDGSLDGLLDESNELKDTGPFFERRDEG